MNLRQLRAFVLIAEHGSIRAAARALFVTQPAATRSLRELEQSVGAELVRRSARGIELTSYGDALYKRAVVILQEARRAHEEIGQMRDGEGGTLNLAVSSAALTVLPAALAAFRARMPRVAVAFNEVAPPFSHEQLESGRYDFLVQTEYDGDIDDGFARTTLFTLPLAVGARAGHPLRHACSLAELHDALWLLPGNIQAPTNLLSLAFAAHQLPAPRDVIPCQSIAVALAIIADSDALGIFVRNLFEHRLLPRGLRRVALAHELPAARVSILTRADSPPTPAARCFIDCLRDAHAGPAI
ncbi:LysR family transcriptional regulator [Achromobacter piechaudii]|uniref:HTH-type transcriptional regulator TsaR n=1 Tax=Achromobacter piechaudii TaxID=72556 RepID=A0ABM8KTC4_9BURK|nr:LysR substrate-binding domain-containing protein [Achromobacter piechaudii]KNY11648.1 LysR family transcriptional regulator [Achromobacter piechaudii]CAB3672048.1 HTH-type transcriptional regulator TsaR [Achromobacter piechaudii]CAB3836750.1 HTH-type transcriptional regulator TsaR [Achromobacter piechaudii]CAB3943081.1 HTH-type transcriptional regulator TsaR [Achromobacter piechaudii]